MGQGRAIGFPTGCQRQRPFRRRTNRRLRSDRQDWDETFERSSEFIPYGAPVLKEGRTNRIEEIRLRPGTYRLVVARMVPENNVDLALDALLETTGESVIVGTGKGDTPLEQRLSVLHDEGRIRWLGHVSDQELLDQLWSHCQIYIHGHSVGGTNPALLQALGAGAPTVVLDTPFNREVVGNPEQHYQAEVEYLARLIIAPARNRNFGKRGAAKGRESSPRATPGPISPTATSRRWLWRPSVGTLTSSRPPR